jgi:two-component system, OmpR family, sensor kinase
MTTAEAMAGPMTTVDRRARSTARTQILVWYALVVAGTLAVSVFVLRQALLAALDRRVDAAITQEVSELSAFTSTRSITDAESLRSAYDQFLQTSVPDRNELFLTIIEGVPFEISADAPARIDRDPAFLRRVSTIIDSTWLTIGSEAGPARVLAFPALQDGRPVGVFVIARFVETDRADVDDAVRRAALLALASLLAVSGIAWLVAGRVLKPLELLSAEATRVTDTALQRRLPESGPSDIATLIRSYNAMLDRLHSSFTTQRQFLDDAGHELRTPLTIARGHLELAGDDPDDRAAATAVALDEMDRMGRIVDDLLLIAKSEQPDFLVTGPEDLDELMTSLFDRVRVLGDHDWQLGSTPACLVNLDRQRITQAMLNLAVNAARHTPPGGRIVIGAEATPTTVRLSVSDSGEGIDARDHQRVFERFTRGSTQRSPGGSAGLGLSIVDAIARAHGGHVELDSRLGAGATFTLVIPQSDATDAQANDHEAPWRAS